MKYAPCMNSAPRQPRRSTHACTLIIASRRRKRQTRIAFARKSVRPRNKNVPVVEYVHASHPTRSLRPRRPSKHLPRSESDTWYPMRNPLLGQYHRRHRHCYLWYLTHSRVSMWHPTTAQCGCLPTRLSTRNSNPSTHKIHRSMNRSVSAPLHRPQAHHPWCHMTSRSRSHNPPLPRVGRLHHQRNLVLFRTSRSLSCHSLLQLKIHPRRHVSSPLHFSLALIMSFSDLRTSLYHA